jgi:hypothetical protein
MYKIALSIVLLLITVANSQRLFYVKCGDGNSSPGYFVFGENGTLLHAWFEKIISNVHMTAIYNYLDGLFYTQTFTGYQIDNPATQSVVTTINSPWPGYGYAIDVRAVDSTQFDIVSGTAQGLYTYNSKTSQFTMVNNGTDYDAFETVAVSPLTNAIYARRKAPAGGVYAVNGTDGSLRLIKEDWITFQMFGDPLDKDNLYVSQYNSGTDSVRTLDVNAGVTQPLYNHEVATFTLSPDGFSYALAFCCTTDTTLRRYDARNGLPFAEDNNFGFDVKQPILNYTGESDASYRYMTVLWSPPRVDLCSIGGSKSISMQFKRYNWTADMELQVSNLFEPIFRTVETVTSSIYMEETVIKSFNLTLYKNASTLYRFRIKYIGRIQWTGYSVHKEMTISASSFDAVTPCPNDFITAPNPPITTSVPVAEPVQEFTPEAPEAPEAPGASVVAPAVIIPIVGSAAIAVLVILLIRRRNKKRAKKNVESKDESMHDTTYSPIAAIAGKRDITVTNPLNVTPPRGDRMNIPRDSLVIGTEIGKGSYGRVYLGEWNSTTVAIKVATTAGTSTFEKELELMLHLTPHPNVLQILGYSYEGVLPLLVLEYCNGGGLDEIIFDQSRPLSVVQQLNLIAGIARGILHLHNNNVVHRDIAARNVLLSSAGEPKVADFGFSRVVEAAGGQTDSTVGPVCWMAPESLRSQKYSFKTDVWSFGVLMYEILARQEPYKGMSVLDVGPKIRDEGMTPNESVIDGSVPQELRNIMKSCWKMDPDERPSFTDICTKLDGLKKDFNLTDRVVGQPTSPNLRELVNETKYVTKI